MEPEKKCSKCGKDPAGPKGMCKTCAAEYQRDYNRTRDAMTYSRGFMTGFAEGVQAQRQKYLDELATFAPMADVMVREVIDYLANSPKPAYTARPVEAEV